MIYYLKDKDILRDLGFDYPIKIYRKTNNGVFLIEDTTEQQMILDEEWLFDFQNLMAFSTMYPFYSEIPDHDQTILDNIYQNYIDKLSYVKKNN